MIFRFLQQDQTELTNNMGALENLLFAVFVSIVLYLLSCVHLKGDDVSSSSWEIDLNSSQYINLE
jgi:hypothetical protein